jgi:hypothetical protein
MVARTNAPVRIGPRRGRHPGRTLFNNVCSHCHGTDGASPVSERDLRKLQRRYKDNWKDTALTTIKNGPPGCGNALMEGDLQRRADRGGDRLPHHLAEVGGTGAAGERGWLRPALVASE